MKLKTTNTVRPLMAKTSRLLMTTAIAALCGAYAASGYAGTTQSGSPKLTPQAKRISDETIHADHKTFDAMQGRIRALNAAGVPLNNYNLAKAQAYLDLALDEYGENDRSSFPELALVEADRLLRALEFGTTEQSLATYPLDPDNRTKNGQAKDTRLPETRLRPDLWAVSDRIKQHPQFPCAAVPTAQLEVELLHAIHEDRSGGWRRSSPFIAIAEDFSLQAQKALDGCVAAAKAAEQARQLANAVASANVPAKRPEPEPVPVAVAVKQPEPQPVIVQPAPPPAPQVIVQTQTLIVLSEQIFFAFGKVEVLDAGQARLREVAAVLNAPTARDRRIFVDGYTDDVGGTASNQLLSEHRAESVRQALIAAGVEAGRLTVRAFGESRPVVPNRRKDGSDDPEGRAQNRRVELILETP